MSGFWIADFRIADFFLTVADRSDRLRTQSIRNPKSAIRNSAKLLNRQSAAPSLILGAFKNITMLRFHNTLSGRVEEFQPMKEGEVGFLYYCGPTGSNCGHMGNFRSAVAADILRRYLKYKGFKVRHVMNITDVEDRVIAKSQEAGPTIDEYTQQYIDALWEDFDALGCERPEIVPRATRHIPEMVSLIEKLLANDHAYRIEWINLLPNFFIPKLWKTFQDQLCGNIAGGSERIDTDRYEKEDARDFALWKQPENRE